MPQNEGFQILHNGVPRTFRDKRETAFEAARYAKSKSRGELIEIVDLSTGATGHAGGRQDGLARDRFGEAASPPAASNVFLNLRLASSKESSMPPLDMPYTVHRHTSRLPEARIR